MGRKAKVITEPVTTEELDDLIELLVEPSPEEPVFEEVVEPTISKDIIPEEPVVSSFPSKIVDEVVETKIYIDDPSQPHIQTVDNGTGVWPRPRKTYK